MLVSLQLRHEQARARFACARETRLGVATMVTMTYQTPAAALRMRAVPSLLPTGLDMSWRGAPSNGGAGSVPAPRTSRVVPTPAVSIPQADHAFDAKQAGPPRGSSG